MLDYLKRRINSKDDKFHLIYNGVDPDDFSNISAKKFDKCTIVYTGLINETFYSPEILFKSIVELKNERSDLSSAIQFIFLGKITQPVFDLIEKYDIDDIVFYKGFLPKKETISYIKGANYLLLLLNPGVTDYLTISGKIFEYLFSENKILALIPKKSAAGEILKDYSNSLILNPLDVKIIKQTIKDIVNNSEKEQILRINDKIIIAKFNRKLQSEQLANLIK
jgi:glycosyltransferase involved in cell wall biosynthesis